MLVPCTANQFKPICTRKKHNHQVSCVDPTSELGAGGVAGQKLELGHLRIRVVAEAVELAFAQGVEIVRGGGPIDARTL
jgi:hypothetical protein